MKATPGKNLNILITGGSRGIGRSIAHHLAREYAHTIVINYLENDVEAEITRKQVEAHNTKCILAKANL